MKIYSNPLIALAIFATTISLVMPPVAAHHSFAAYDMSRSVTVEGTLKEFRWGAPHSSMVLIYTEKRQVRQMSVAGGSPMSFSRQGLSPRDFKRGDKVRVTYYPNTSGQPGGALMKLRLPNGKSFSDTEAARAAG